MITSLLIIAAITFVLAALSFNSPEHSLMYRSGQTFVGAIVFISIPASVIAGFLIQRNSDKEILKEIQAECKTELTKVQDPNNCKTYYFDDGSYTKKCESVLVCLNPK